MRFKNIILLCTSAFGIQIDAASAPETATSAPENVLAKISAAPTSGVDYDIFVTLNKYRTNPLSAVADLTLMKSQFTLYYGYQYLAVPGESMLSTIEGPAAYDVAINFMNSMKAVSALTWNDKLTSAAVFHNKDIGPLGLT